MAAPAATAGWILRIGPYANIAGRCWGWSATSCTRNPMALTEQRDGGQQLVGGLAHNSARRSISASRPVARSGSR